MIQNFRKALTRQSVGVTLTEMLIVIALIALVGTLVTTQIIGKYQKAQADAAKIQIKQMGTILEQFRLDCGTYPTAEQGLEALIEKPPGYDCERYDPQGYVEGKKLPKDPWGKEFIYNADGKTYEIISLGADRQEGGEDYNADISSKNLD